jgi:hypothetical protein
MRWQGIQFAVWAALAVAVNHFYWWLAALFTFNAALSLLLYLRASALREGTDKA